MIKELAILIAVAGAVVALGLYVLPMLGFSFDLSGIIGQGTGMLSGVWDTWNALPQTVKTIMLTGIPVVVGIVGWWAKLQWQKYATRMKEELTAKNVQLQGELEAKNQEIGAATSQGISTLIQEKENAVATMQEAQQLLAQTKQQMADMQKQHLVEMQTMQNAMNELKLQEKVVVK